MNKKSAYGQAMAAASEGRAHADAANVSMLGDVVDCLRENEDAHAAWADLSAGLMVDANGAHTQDLAQRLAALYIEQAQSQGDEFSCAQDQTAHHPEYAQTKVDNDRLIRDTDRMLSKYGHPSAA